MGGPSDTTRFWWRSWKTRTLLALVVTVFIVRLIWGWWVDRQLQAQLSALRQRGEPVEVGDVKYPAVPDAENAWVPQMQAAGVVARSGVDSPRNSSFDFWGPPFPAQWWKLAEASEKAHGPAFALARQARQRSGVQFRKSLPSPLAAVLVLYLTPAKDLANTIADGALYAHLKGDDTEAIERLLDILHLSRSLRHDDFMISQLVAMGIDAVACNAAQTIAPGLHFDASATTTHPATRTKVRQLMDQLLNDELATRSLRQSLAMERVGWIDYARTRSASTWMIQPLAGRQILRNLPNYDITIEASTLTDWPRVRAAISLAKWDKSVVNQSAWMSVPTQQPAVPRYSRWFQDYADVYSRYLEIHFRTLAERRATALSLACQLYRADHGRWPDRLDQLVPAYLAAVPADPFCGDGKSFGYRILKSKLPGGGARPLLSFEAGEKDYIANEPMYGWTNDTRPSRTYKPIRQYRDLARFAPPPSTKAVDDNPQKSDAPGDQSQQDEKANQPKAQ